ncbi:MAG: FAD-dependent oxidoreductase [Pedobacter sp.]|nr:MAG: FAD-dependent oxidoreductase [Pedobacter sp.]
MNLQNAGKSCLLVEAHEIGYGTTGGTSAHLNTFLDATYPEIERDFNGETAKLVAEAAKSALEIIHKNLKLYEIKADCETKEGILYAETEAQLKTLNEIYEASLRSGVEVEELHIMDLNVPFLKSLKFHHQAQFHPLKYIHGLLNEYLDRGGHYMENTKYEAYEKASTDNMLNISLNAGAGVKFSITTNHLVFATHIPPGITTFNFTCAPYRSYVIAVKLQSGSYPEQLYYDMQEPYHYWRTHEIDFEPYLLVGGEDHKTGQGDEAEAYKNLLDYIKQYYDVKEVSYAWSSQYYVPIDGLPYIGKMPLANEHVWLATGYNGNGMIWGTQAGSILTDLILGKENAYAEFLNPSRIKPIAGFTEFVKENANAVWQLIVDRLSAYQDDIAKIAPNSGEVIQTKEGKVAVFKASDGSIKAFNATCTHAGCVVKYNALEKSWDCPCHGGRYDLDGKVITGPPIKNLEPIDLS